MEGSNFLVGVLVVWVVRCGVHRRAAPHFDFARAPRPRAVTLDRSFSYFVFVPFEVSNTQNRDRPLPRRLWSPPNNQQRQKGLPPPWLLPTSSRNPGPCEDRCLCPPPQHHPSMLPRPCQTITIGNEE